MPVEKTRDSYLFKKINFVTLVYLFSVTLFFVPNMQDPFNAGKQIFLFIFSAWYLGCLFANLTQLKGLFKETWFQSFFAFICVMFISTINTKSKYLGFFGAEQRRNGFLTYLAFFIILTSIVVYFNHKLVDNLINLAIVLASITGVYGLIQSFGIDFVKWNNPYNSILSTYGNPNFASASYAIFISILVFNMFSASKIKIFRNIFLFLNCFLLLFVIYKSQSRQGMLALFFGCGLTLLVLLIKINRKFAYMYILGFAILSLFGVLGMLQKGPFAGLLYKESLSVRGFYWRSAFEMVKANPIFGIGIDSYGLSFKQFRDFNYPLRYGYQITSSNAHSVPLQFLSTGGLILFILYVSIIFYVLVSGVKLIISSKDSELFKHSAIFSGWITYLAQSLISIDQIALAAWNWILMALIIGSYRNKHSQTSPITLRNNIRRFNSPSLILIPNVLVIIICLPCFYLFQGENMAWRTRSLAGLINSTENVKKSLMDEVQKMAEATKKVPLQSPYNKFLVSRIQSDYSLSNQGMETIRKLLKEQPNNLDYLGSLAFYLERDQNYDEAYQFRILIEKYDPFNAENLLVLGQYAKVNKNLEKEKYYLDKILRIAPNTKISQIAITELG